MNPDRHKQFISLRANRILNLFLVALLLILFRVWHLAVIQYETKLEESRKPQLRTFLEPTQRATIRDRFNHPLAINKIRYNAAIIYAPLRQIPSISWKKDASGKKIKIFKRREYIANLAQFLGNQLKIDPERVEDLIHAKASLYHNLPFVIKEDLSEEEYYRLKIAEKDWLGIHVQKLSKRDYPRGKVACDIIGYMGAINRQEYESILEEIQTLEIFLNECGEGVSPELHGGVLTLEQATSRLKDLQEHAYTINDYVGKAGIEGRFEQDLRGFHGKKTFYSDAKGNFLREMPGSREPLPGQRLLLTISADLQEFAEKLLAQNERIREARASKVDAHTQTLLSRRQPWIKGGSIVAMDPKTGEILALASYPRFDPSDFISSGNPEINKHKKKNIGKWFEDVNYIGEIWDQKRPLEREFFQEETQSYQMEQKWLSWEEYLNFILPQENVVRQTLEKNYRLRQLVEFQKNVDQLLKLSGQENPNFLLQILYREEESKIPQELKKGIENQLRMEAKAVASIKQKLDLFFEKCSCNYERILLLDLTRLIARADLFDETLLQNVGLISISAYREATSAKVEVFEIVKQMAKTLFHEQDFKCWRKAHEKEFLREKRMFEKEHNQYTKPYIDYLDQKESELFQAFWEKQAFTFVLALVLGESISKDDLDLNPYLDHFYKWREEILAGAHAEISWYKSYLTLKKSLEHLEPAVAVSYLKTMRGFQDLTQPLAGRYRSLRKTADVYLEKDLAAAFYPNKGYGYGRSQAYRQSAPQGSIFKLVTAYAALSQKFQMLNGKKPSFADLNPLEMTDHTHRRGKELCIGYHANGSPLPRAYKGGRLPRSTHPMGKLDLLKAIENSSNPYFALLAGDFLKSPEDLAQAARQFSYGARTGIDLPAEISGKIPADLSSNRTGLYATAIGQHSLVVTPLQASVMLATIANGGHVLKPKIVKISAGKKTLTQYAPFIQREIFMPSIIRKILLEGMRRVVAKTQEESLASLSRFYSDYPEAISDYLDLKEELVGKTSTAEVMENIDLDRQHGTHMFQHVWFGGISFDRQKNGGFLFKDKFGEPELVVVVYLRYGAFGKEAAPLAAQIVQKWREIKTKL